MSKIEEMLKRFDLENQIIAAPLSEYFDMYSGMSAVTLKWQDTGNCKFIDYMNVYMHRRVDVKALHNATVKSQNQTILQKGDVLFTVASEVPDECAIAGEIEEDFGERVFLDDHLFCLRLKRGMSDKIAKGYLKYAFNAFDFRSQVKKAVRGVTRFYVAKEDFMKLHLSLPPRPVQDEIVKALDAMDAAVKALEEERAARQEQFEAVREKEMIECCSANVERISLSEMGEFFSGLAGKSKDDFVEGNAKFLSYMDVFVNSAAPTDVANFVRVMPGERQNQLQVGDIVFTGSSETKDEAGMTCVIQTEFAEPVYLNSFCFGLRPNVSVQMKPEFAKYVFRSVVVRNQIIRASNGVTRFNVSKEALKKVQIPIPSVAVQKKIAAQLDAFAAVVAAQDEEVAARREQFAGWLEKLMKFDAREVAVA